MEDRLQRLGITDDTEEGFKFPQLGETQEKPNYDLCLDGKLLLTGR